MKKTYIEPEMAIVEINPAEIIATSGTGGSIEGGGGMYED